MQELLRDRISIFFFPGFIIGIFGLLFVVIGLSAQRERRLSNVKFLWAVTGTRKFEGRTAVFLGEVVAFVGFVFVGIAACLMLLSGFVFIAKARAPQESPPETVPAYNTPLASNNAAKQGQPGTGNSTASSNSPSANGSNTPQSTGPTPSQSAPPSSSPPHSAPSGGGAPPWASSPPGGVGSPPSGFGPPGGELNEVFRKHQEEFERKRREMEERHRNLRNGQPTPKINAPPAAPARPVREWKSANGKYTINGSLVEQTATEAVIRQSDGSTVRVEKSKLSSEDQKWLAENP